MTIHCVIRLQGSQEEDMRGPDTTSKDVELSCVVVIQSLGHTKEPVYGNATSHLISWGQASKDVANVPQIRQDQSR